MAKEPLSSKIPYIDPNLPKVLREVYPHTFDLNATDREIGAAFGRREIIEFLETISEQQGVGVHPRK